MCNLFCNIVATLLQNDGSRFTAHFQTCLATNQVLLFATKPVHVARFTGQRQTCFAASEVTPVYGVTPA